VVRDIIWSVATFRFANIRADVKRLGPEEPGFDLYGVTLTDPDGNWIEMRAPTDVGDRTTADDFDLAYGSLQSLYAAATVPDVWRVGHRRTELSDLELDTTISMAKRMEPWLEDAVKDGEARWDLYQEGRETGAGPLDA